MNLTRTIIGICVIFLLVPTLFAQEFNDLSVNQDIKQLFTLTVTYNGELVSYTDLVDKSESYHLRAQAVFEHAALYYQLASLKRDFEGTYSIIPRQDITKTLEAVKQTQEVPEEPQTLPVEESPDMCFPLAQSSFKANKQNFGDARDGGTRCHVGVDLLTQGEGKVVALADGEVLSVQTGFLDCSGGAGGAVLVYHPSLDKTVNYGEINANSITLKKGNTVTKGQALGKATYCGMLHFELYEGKQSKNIRWFPSSGKSSAGIKNKCAQEFLTTKNPSILDPTSLLNSLDGKFCDGSVKQPQQFTSQKVTQQEPTLEWLTNQYQIFGEYGNLENTPDKLSLYIRLEGQHVQKYMSQCMYADVNPRDQPGDTYQLQSSEKKYRPVAVVYPSSFDPTKPVSVYMYFHGTASNIVRSLYAKTKQLVLWTETLNNKFHENAILVVPQGPDVDEYHSNPMRAWLQKGDEEGMNCLFKELQQQYTSYTNRPLQIKKIILSGHSAGTMPMQNSVDELKTLLDASRGDALISFDACYGDRCRTLAHELPSIPFYAPSILNENTENGTNQLQQVVNDEKLQNVHLILKHPAGLEHPTIPLYYFAVHLGYVGLPLQTSVVPVQPQAPPTLLKPQEQPIFLHDKQVWSPSLSQPLTFTTALKVGDVINQLPYDPEKNTFIQILYQPYSEVYEENLEGYGYYYFQIDENKRVTWGYIGEFDNNKPETVNGYTFYLQKEQPEGVTLEVKKV